MRRAIAPAGTLLAIVAMVFIVQFLGEPVRGEPQQRGVVYRPRVAAPESAAEAEAKADVVGQVVDRRGQPLRGVRVLATPVEHLAAFRRLELEGPPEILAETSTGEDGTFALTDLSVDPGAEDGARVRVWAGGGRWLFAMTHAIDLRADEAAHGIALVVVPAPAPD